MRLTSITLKLLAGAAIVFVAGFAMMLFGGAEGGAAIAATPPMAENCLMALL
ncbi:MAG: hypothetical protein AAGJ73_06525 [Pseudomonadota bacterium]